MSDSLKTPKQLAQEHLENMAAVLKQQHAQWLEHPCTQTILGAIRQHKNGFIELMSNNASNTAVNDTAFRSFAINLRNTDAILAVMTNADVLCNVIYPALNVAKQDEQAKPVQVKQQTRIN